MDPLELAWLAVREDADTGISEFCAVALPLVARALPERDEHVALTAATDAVLELLEHPDRYDPARLSLFKFLRMAAYRDLMNLWEKEKRHREGRESGDLVELASDARNQESEEPTMLEDFPPLVEAIAELPPEDQAVLALMRQGERATTAYAAVLNLGDRPANELAAEVKRAKDRILARLKRAGRTT